MEEIKHYFQEKTYGRSKKERSFYTRVISLLVSIMSDPAIYEYMILMTMAIKSLS